jgi:hypothetical protein
MYSSLLQYSLYSYFVLIIVIAIFVLNEPGILGPRPTSLLETGNLYFEYMGYRMKPIKNKRLLNDPIKKAYSTKATSTPKGVV